MMRADVQAALHVNKAPSKYWPVMVVMLVMVMVMVLVLVTQLHHCNTTDS
jgi:Tfp pilus assembly protein PilO